MDTRIAAAKYADPIKVLWATALAFLLSFSNAQLSAAQDADRFLRWTYQDGAALVNDVGPHLPVMAFGGAALLLPGSTLDAPVLNGIQSGHDGIIRDYLGVANELGSIKMVPVAAGVFGASLALGDARFQDAAFTSLQSVVYANAAVFGLKYGVGRFRPEADMGARSYDLFSGNTSFPSGHTATAFALFTPWVMYYPGPATYALMALPVGTAVARIARDRHWPTDVIAGAAIGFLTAKFLSERHMNEASGGTPPRIQVTPGVTPDALSLHLRIGL